MQNIRDYISWRQADTHINNLYNTCFWALVLRGNETTTSAEKILNGSLSSDKNEILFSRFGINYNNEPEIFKKGSIVIRETKERILDRMETKPSTISCPFSKEEIESLSDGAYETVVLHCDVIRDKPFWEDHPSLLDSPVCSQQTLKTDRSRFKFWMKIPFFTPRNLHHRPIRCSCPIPATTNLPDGAKLSEFTNPFYTPQPFLTPTIGIDRTSFSSTPSFARFVAFTSHNRIASS